MTPLLIILLNFIVGTLCLMYGVNRMSKSLESANIKRIEKILSMFTGKTIYAFITGTVITALVQSSTAVTVLTVGLVNSGIIRLSQAVGIIFGANIGTTVTAQLISFKLSDLAIPILVAAFIIKQLVKRQAIKTLCLVAIGFGFIFIGIGILNSGVPYIKESKAVYEIFKVYGQNPYLGLIAGMLVTMLVHSSSATVGLTIVLFNAGLISFDAALGLTLGDNIGTCITAQIASLGGNIHGRRAAWAHTLYNVIGVLLALMLFSPFAKTVIYCTQLLGQDRTRLIANAHTIFNILSAVLFLPLTRYYVRFIEWIIPKGR